jgi:hypothetical protein
MYSDIVSYVNLILRNPKMFIFCDCSTNIKEEILGATQTTRRAKMRSIDFGETIRGSQY